MWCLVKSSVLCKRKAPLPKAAGLLRLFSYRRGGSRLVETERDGQQRDDEHKWCCNQVQGRMLAEAHYQYRLMHTVYIVYSCVDMVTVASCDHGPAPSAFTAATRTV